LILSKRSTICRSNLILYSLIPIAITIVSPFLIQQGVYAKNQVATTTANIHPIAPTTSKTNATCNDISGCINDKGVSGTVYDPRTGTTTPLVGSITTGSSSNAGKISPTAVNKWPVRDDKVLPV
jgi:hypothetical protein